MFICLNPSTADETLDDPTVRRCINFSRDWGFDAFCMTNIFAWRDTDPRKMKAAPEPVGADNDETLLRLSKQAGIVVAAWGSHGDHLGRGNAVKAMIPSLHCLSVTKGGFPGHPLYLPATSKPVPFI